jgi:hypothetical protein
VPQVVAMLGAAFVLDPAGVTRTQAPGSDRMGREASPFPRCRRPCGRLGGGRAVWGTLSIEQTMNNLLTGLH